MNKTDLVKAVLNTPSACPEFKEAAQNYLDSIGTDKEKEAGRILVEEAQEDISPIDGTIQFFCNRYGKRDFRRESCKTEA